VLSFRTAAAEALYSCSLCLKAMNDKVSTLARVVNGWQMNTDTMGVYGVSGYLTLA